MRIARVPGLFRFATRDRLRVLAYHGVEDRPDAVNADGFFVPPSVFAEHLDHAARHYRPITINDVVRTLAGGDPWPDRALLVTFDDGYLNNAEQAAPILSAKGIPAVFFTTTGFIDGTHQPWWLVFREWIRQAGPNAFGPPPDTPPDRVRHAARAIGSWEAHLKGLTAEDRDRTMSELANRIGLPPRNPAPFMTWDHLAGLLRDGFDVEPHTVSHPNLGRESVAQVDAEINGSIQRLAAKLGRTSQAFAYPYGRFTDVQPAVADLLRDAGIACGFTTVHGFNRRRDDPYSLFRINATGHHRGFAFEKLLAMG